jgi:hypothetical protein
MITWRASQPVRRTIKEVQQIVIAHTLREWQALQNSRNRRAHKRRFRSLRELIASTQLASGR